MHCAPIGDVANEVSYVAVGAQCIYISTNKKGQVPSITQNSFTSRPTKILLSFLKNYGYR